MKLVLAYATSAIISSIVYVMGIVFYASIPFQPTGTWKFDQYFSFALYVVTPFVLIQQILFVSPIIVYLHKKRIALERVRWLLYITFGAVIAAVPWSIIILWPSCYSESEYGFFYQYGNEVLVENGKYTAAGVRNVTAQLVWIAICGMCAGLVFGGIIKCRSILSTYRK